MNRLMVNFIFNLGHPISKNKVLYYILNLTWGLPLTLLGVVLTLLCLPFIPLGVRIKRYHYIYYVELPLSGFGGFSIGTTFFVGRKSKESTLCHEFGHTVQNAIFGPFMLFVVSLPSVTRWWWRHFKIKKGLGKSLMGYNHIWFEGSAQAIGDYCEPSQS